MATTVTLQNRLDFYSLPFVLFCIMILFGLFVHSPNVIRIDPLYDDFYPPIIRDSSVSTCVFGESGVGKSKFGNTYLRKDAFKTGSNAEPVTLGPTSNYSEIDGFRRYVIDTEGLNDGVLANSVHIARLGQFIRNYPLKIHSLVLVINGQNDRFSQGVQDLIRYIYNSFPSQCIFNNFCIVFTKCYKTRNNLNYQQQKLGFMLRVRWFLSNISYLPIGEIPEIPAFYIDSKDRNKYRYGDTYRNLYEFHKWTCSRVPLNTEDFVDANFQEQYEKEYEKNVYTSTIERDNITYNVYVNRTRYKIIPNNGEKIRYTEWLIESSYYDKIRQCIMSITIKSEGNIKKDNKCYRVKKMIPTKTIKDYKRNKTFTEEFVNKAKLKEEEIPCPKEGFFRGIYRYTLGWFFG